MCCCEHLWLFLQHAPTPLCACMHLRAWNHLNMHALFKLPASSLPGPSAEWMMCPETWEQPYKQWSPPSVAHPYLVLLLTVHSLMSWGLLGPYQGAPPLPLHFYQ
jgi:hypothetical protein